MKKLHLLLAVLFAMLQNGLLAQTFDGLDNNLSNLYRMSDAKTRIISPENLTGDNVKGGKANLGEGATSHLSLIHI